MLLQSASKASLNGFCRTFTPKYRCFLHRYFGINQISVALEVFMKPISVEPAKIRCAILPADQTTFCITHKENKYDYQKHVLRLQRS